MISFRIDLIGFLKSYDFQCNQIAIPALL